MLELEEKKIVPEILNILEFSGVNLLLCSIVVLYLACRSVRCKVRKYFKILE